MILGYQQPGLPRSDHARPPAAFEALGGYDVPDSEASKARDTAGASTTIPIL